MPLAAPVIGSVLSSSRPALLRPDALPPAKRTRGASAAASASQRLLTTAPAGGDAAPNVAAVVALLNRLSTPTVTALLRQTSAEVYHLVEVLPPEHHGAALRACAKHSLAGPALVLDGCRCGSEDDNVRLALIASLPSVPDTASLSLTKWEFADRAQTTAIAGALMSLTALTSLRLANGSTTWHGMHALFSALQQLSSLRHLSLEGSADDVPTRAPRPAHRFVAQALELLPHLAHLTIADCCDTHLRRWRQVEAAGRFASAAAHFTRLTNLTLIGRDLNPSLKNDTEDSELPRNLAPGTLLERAFAKLASARALAHLDLSGSALGCAGIARLAQSLPSQLPQLTHLNLASNRMKRDGIAHLPRLLSSAPKLQHLNLSNNSLRDMHTVDIAAALAELTAMTHLNLSGACTLSCKHGSVLLLCCFATGHGMCAGRSRCMRDMHQCRHKADSTEDDT